MVDSVRGAVVGIQQQIAGLQCGSIGQVREGGPDRLGLVRDKTPMPA